MAHALQMIISFALVLAALGAGHLFVVVAIVEMVRGREQNWAFVSNARRNQAGFR